MHRNIEQIPLQQSTEWHHSIIDWISHEAFVVVRPRAYMLEDLRSHELSAIYGVLLQHRDLANNHLESPLPSFLQTTPAIDTLDLRNNSFVREICSQRGGKCQSLNAHLTHAYMLADVSAPSLV